MTNLLIGRGAAMAAFLGISSPIRNENTVAAVREIPIEIALTVLGSRSKPASDGSMILASDGSAKKPVSMVVTVIPI
jgi:hypothetical protein